MRGKLLVSILLAPSLQAADLVPLGPSKVLHEYTQYDQRQPWVACDDAGNFVLVYSFGDIFMRRFDRDGNPLGPETLVNPTINWMYQDECHVSVDPVSGDFVIAWSDRHGNDGMGMGCGGRFYKSDGTPYGPEFILNQVTLDAQFEPYVAVSPKGRVLGVWADTHVDGSCGAVGRLFDRDGTPLTPDFLINTPSTKTQINPSVWADRLGNFVVAFDDASGATGEPREVLVRLYDYDAQPKGPPFLALSDSKGHQHDNHVATAANGDFVVAWQDWSANDGSGEGVFARMFHADGTPKGPQFQISANGIGSQLDPMPVMDYVGNVTFVWDDNSAGNWDVKMRRFDRNGVPLTGDLLVHELDSADQTWGKVAVSHNGQRMVVVWYQNGDIWGRVFELPLIMPSAPLAAGSTTQLQLDLPGMGGETYLLLAALGTAPGIKVTGHRTLQLANDLLFQFTLAYPNSSLLQGGAGTLNPSGKATAAFSLPAIPALSGIDVSFVALTIDGGQVGMLTDAKTLTIQ